MNSILLITCNSRCIDGNIMIDNKQYNVDKIVGWGLGLYFNK